MVPKALNYLHGVEIITSKFAVDVIEKRVRTHRAKRIDKKWLKRYGYRQVEIPSRRFFVMGNKIICHPFYVEKIKEALVMGE